MVEHFRWSLLELAHETEAQAWLFHYRQPATLPAGTISWPYIIPYLR